MTTIRIYDPAMCCDTGVCGPTTDPVLVQIAVAVEALQQKGFDIERYNLTTQPEQFAEALHVLERIQEDGIDSLPIVVKDDVIFSTATYPDVEQLAAWFHVEPQELLPARRHAPTVDLSFESRHSN